MSTSKPFSSEQVPRTLSIVIEREQNRTERIENGYGMGMDAEQIKKNTRTGIRIEWQQSAFCQAFPDKVSSDLYCTCTTCQLLRPYSSPLIHSRSQQRFN